MSKSSSTDRRRTASSGKASKPRTRKAAPARKKRGPTPPGTDDTELTRSVARPRAFAIRKSAIAGRGAFATRDIRKGERIAEYVGKRITPDEADERYPFPENGEPHHTFLFNLDDYTVVDGSEQGDSCRFINHSCDPNCETVIEDDRIFVDTIRAVKKGAELVYDYQFILDEPHTPAAKRQYPCYCGSKKCRGTILTSKRKKLS